MRPKIIFLVFQLLFLVIQVREIYGKVIFHQFMALHSNEINLRLGPGLEYPISFVYKHKDLPVMVTGNHGSWLRIMDIDGLEGWVYQSMLSRRMTVITKSGFHILQIKSRDSNKALAYVYPGVVGKILDCKGLRCYIRFLYGGTMIKGWMRQSELWGI